MPDSAILRCRNLHKEFVQGDSRIAVLQGLELTLPAHGQLAIIGASGSGKSTLLHLLGGLDRPDHGKIWINGVEISRLNTAERCRLRNRAIGFVYQFHHLLAEFSCLENVALPLLIAGKTVTLARREASSLLQRVGLTPRLHHRPAALSGGERQRVAVARALANRPACVLADEPTGNLDEENAAQIYTLMQELQHQEGTAFVIATHDQTLARGMDKVLQLRAGQLHAPSAR